MNTHATTLSADLLAYVSAHSVREPELLCRLRRAAADMSEGSWQVSPEQGQFMALLAGCASSNEPPFEINNKQFYEKQDAQGNKLFALWFR